MYTNLPPMLLSLVLLNYLLISLDEKYHGIFTSVECHYYWRQKRREKRQFYPNQFQQNQYHSEALKELSNLV